jgi:ribonuclease HI
VDAHVWTIIGLSVDIVGALLLSVEAIKVRNLESAAGRLVRITHRITIVHAADREPERVAWLGPAVFWSTLTVTSVLLLTFIGGRLPSERSWQWVLAVVGLAVLGVLALFFVAMAAAFLLFALTLLAEAAVRGVAVVDTRTADGTIGIVGAGMMVLGFSMQIIGAPRRSEPRVKTVVWTDGSCNANKMHGRGGWAALIEQAGTVVREISGSAQGTTHNRMELTAICEALETLTGIIEVRTDSAYVEKCFNHNWHERWLRDGSWKGSNGPVKNRDLWERLFGLVWDGTRDVTFVWIRGHAGDANNHRVDRLARAAALSAG